MSVKVREYRPDDDSAIGRLNARLAAGGAPWTVYGAGPGDGAQMDPLSSRLFVADNADEIRGAVWLREHLFHLSGEAVVVGWAKYPVAESLVDASFGGVPGALMFRLQREQAKLMALGMGGREGAFARLLRGMGWTAMDVPFLFSLARPARVLRRLRPMRRTALRRALLDAAALTGLGWLGWRLLERIRRRPLQRSAVASAETEERFGEWADTLWSEVSGSYEFIARRDAKMLNTVYPASMPVTRLRVRRAGRDLGWAVVTSKEFGEHDGPFGPMRVGLIADGLCQPSDAQAVVAAAASFLRTRGVDLLFSNQAHPAWIAALEAEGFVRGPSQFVLARSPQLVKRVPNETPMHINRGDCDGPIFW